ncbi:uncharacterized protein K02A2.6-like [Armigeres subalbatus]|uniref:uncharacterized protein K02A2.6-like n=1 Tax=Armigeres subalbatus TaxID=124917 RepID=UPI002ED67B86
MSIPGMIGTIDHYHVGKSFCNYIERFEIMCKLNKVEPGEKKQWFISLSGDDVFDEIKLLFPKKNVEELDYDEIIQKLKCRFDKTEPALMHRYKFYNKFQGPTESAENFVLAVRLLAESCNFKEFKDEAIRDRLILGLRDKKLQRKILTEDEITVEALERLIINDEEASQRTREIIDHNETANVMSVKYRLGQRYEDKFNSRSEQRDKRFRSRSRSQERFGSHSRSNERNGTSATRVRTDWNGHRNAVCNHCKRVGHIRKNCWFLNKNSVKAVKQDSSEEIAPFDKFNRIRLNESSDESDINCMMIKNSSNANEPCVIEVTIEGRKLMMEVDTGSAVSVISEKLYKKRFCSSIMEPCNRRLVVVNGARLEIAGQILVDVKINTRRSMQKLVILKSETDFTPLLGRDWMEIFYPDWKLNFGTIETVNQLRAEQIEKAIGNIKNKFSKVFSKDFSEPIVGFKADLTFKNEQPIFKRAYEVPYKLKEKFVDHLCMLEQQGVISATKASEWASPVIAIPKKDGEIRMVIDCKVSLNKILIPDTYPLPLAQDIFASLAGSKVFCSLDLTGAYTQLELSERSKKFVVINTIKGLYTFNRLPQGATSSAAMFQQVMDQVLKGIEGVRCYLDDVLIAGKDYADCYDKVVQVLQRLANANVRVNFKKCKFFVESLQYLGHLITKDGLLPSPEKLSTIEQAKTPTNEGELKAYLGLINYYNKFIPNMSAKLRCLYDLLKKDKQFIWTETCDKAFQQSKQSLLSANILDFYDPIKPLVVITDASSYGLGGVLAQIVDGLEKPICFTSFALNNAQKKYPILHLEALALVCVLKKFHKFLFGQKFKVFTDHKPLLGIFGKEGKNSVFVTRIQRYIMQLSIYDFDIEYRPGSKMGNADFCSRFPLDQRIPRSIDPVNINSLNFSNEFPLDFALIARETKKDEFLTKIIGFVVNNWPRNVPKQFRNLFALKEKLQIVEGILLMEDKVVVPRSIKHAVLKLLHANHSGMTKMKQLARRSIYWGGINSDIEDFVKSCETCARREIVPKVKFTETWTPTTRPFSRLHADFFYFDKNTFLLIVDSHSKWLEVEWMRYGTNAKSVIRKFIPLFARFGLPDVVVTDGGPPFQSVEFISFLENQGIKVLKSPPYNPQSNGQAERMVRVVKEVLKKYMLDTKIRCLEIEDKLSLFLINYRNSCFGKEGSFPSERIFSFKPKTLLDLLNPRNSYKNNLYKETTDKTVKINFESSNDKPNHPDNFDKLVAGDKLLYKNVDKKELIRWLDAKFIKKLSKNLFQISLSGHKLTAHRDQLKMVYNRRDQAKVFVTKSTSVSRKRPRSVSDDEEFLGFPDVPMVPEKKKKKGHVHIRSPIVTRSKAGSAVESN